MMTVLVFCTAALGPEAAAAKPRGEKLSVEGGFVAYDVRGEGDPVVLVHGGMLDRRMWDPQLDAFSRSHRVVRFDLRGAGESPAAAKPYHPADDLAALLDKLDIDRAAIVGISMGGSVAVDFALTHPDRVSALVLAEPGLSGYHYGTEIMQVMMKVGTAVQQNDLDAAASALFESPAMKHAMENGLARPLLQKLVRENIGGLMGMQFMRYQEPNQVENVGNIDAPVLLLLSEYAGRDALNIADQVEGQLPATRRISIPGAGHLMNMENPSRFNEAVLEFLNDESTRAANDR